VASDLSMSPASDVAASSSILPAGDVVATTSILPAGDPAAECSRSRLACEVNEVMQEMKGANACPRLQSVFELRREVCSAGVPAMSACVCRCARRRAPHCVISLSTR
jgi:hypothetical protein